jgi:hypothetical protein
MKKSLIFRVVAPIIIQLVVLLTLSAYGLLPKYLIVAVVLVVLYVLMFDVASRIYKMLKRRVDNHKKSIFEQVDLLSKIVFNPNLESSTRNNLIQLIDTTRDMKHISEKGRIGIMALNNKLEKLQQSVNAISSTIINEILSAESKRNIIPRMISDINAKITSIDWLIYPITEDSQTKSYTNIAKTTFEQAKKTYNAFDRSTHTETYKLLVETMNCLAKADFMRLNQDERKATVKKESLKEGLLIDFDFRSQSNGSVH